MSSKQRHKSRKLYAVPNKQTKPGTVGLRKGDKGKEWGKRKKKPSKKFPPCGCKIDCPGRGGRGNRNHFHNIYA